MRAALWILILFALAVAFPLVARLDQGYVVIVYPPWRMELSFMLALLLAIGLAVLAYAGLKLANVALHLSGDVRAWNETRRGKKADKALLDALRAYLDGDLKLTRKLLAKAERSTLAPDLLARVQQLSQEDPPAAALPKSADPA